MSLYAVNLPSGTTDEKGFFRLLGKLFNGSGVIESTALAVTAQGTPTMSLNISGSAASDNAIFITSNGDTYHGWNTTQTTVLIAANATGNTMIDSVVAYINLGGGITTANNPGAFVITSVRGAAASTPPTPTAIQTAVGASNPYIILANITVGNGVSSINSGNIADQRPRAAVNTAYISNVPTLAAGIQETGACGLRVYSYDTTSRIFDYQVNFKTVMSNTPSSVTLTPGGSNNLAAGYPQVASISKYGFRFSMASNSAVGDTRAIDYTYTTVGN